MSSAYDRYVRQLTLINQYRLSQMQSQGGSTRNEFSPNAMARAAMQQYRPPVTRAAAPASIPEKKSTGIIDRILGIRNPMDAVKTAGSVVQRVAMPGVDRLDDVANSSPGRAILDILSRGTYAAAGFADEINDQSRENRASAASKLGIDEDDLTVGDKSLAFLEPYFEAAPYREAWKGLKGEDKITSADVIRENNPEMGRKTSAGLGFTVDVLGDPISLLPVGKAGQVASKIGDKLPILNRTRAAAEGAAETGLVASPNVDVVEKLLQIPPKKPSAVSTDKATISATEKTSTATPDDIIRQAQMSAVVDQLANTPKLAHPEDFDVPNIFKDVETTTVERVPRQVTEEVEIPDSAVPQATSAKPRNPRLSRARAVKASILQNPDYVIGKFKVGELLAAAKTADEPTAKQIDKIFNDEAKKIVSSGAWDKLPKTTQLYGRGGKKAGFGLTLEQMTDLMQRGEIGGILEKYSTKTDEFTKQFPIHSVEDLENVFMNTSGGAQVSMREYLSNLGIEVKAVSQSGDTKDVLKFEDLPEFNIKPKTRTVKKTVYDEVPHTVTKTERMSRAESVLWAAQHTGRLTPEEIAYLRKAESKASFEKRLAEIKARTITDGFATLDDFIEAAKSGLIPKDALDKMFKIVGVTKLADLKAAAERIMKATGPKRIAPETVLKPADRPVTVPNKVERFKADNVPEDDFAVRPAVTNADELMSRVEAGDASALAVLNPNLSELQIRDLTKALPFAILENLIDPQDIAKYPFLSDFKKAKRTSSRAGHGRGRNLHGWHSLSQADVFRSLAKSASSRHPVKPGMKGKENALAWKARAAAMYDEIMPAMRAAENALRADGVRLISGTDNAGLMLSYMDVLDSLPRELVERHLFNPRFSVLPSEILQAADGLVRASMGRVSIDVAKENAVNIFSNSPKLKTLGTKRGGLTQGQKIATDLAEALSQNVEVIMQKVEINYARLGVELGEAVKSMTDEIIANVIKKYANPDVSIGETLGDFAMRSRDTGKIGTKIKAPVEAGQVARDRVDAKLAGVLTPGDFAEAEAARRFAMLSLERERALHQATKIGMDQSKSRSREGLDAVAPTEDLGDRFQYQLTANLFRANVPLLDKVYTMKDALGRAFVADYGHRNLHEALRIERSVTQDFARMHRGIIAQLSDSAHSVYGADTHVAIQEAFRYLQASVIPADPQMATLVNGLKSSLDLTFGSSVDNIGSFAQRNGLFAGHLNEILDYYRAPKSFRFDPSKPFAEQTNDWRTWADVDDPLSLLDTMHAAMQRASVEVTLGRDFSNNFGVPSARPGYVKVTDKKGVSKVGKFINRDLYYPREMVEQLKYLDDVMKGSISNIKNPTAAGIIDIYDKIIHAWKSGLTIYRPGHHVRNLIGDVTLAFFDGVSSPASYAKATRILAGRSKSYQDWDGLKALKEGGIHEGATPGGSISLTVRGKRIKLTDDQIWRAAFKQGIIPDYRTLEDIAFNTEQSLQFKTGKGVSITRPTGGWLQKQAGGLSQARDHWVRMAHFVNVLEKGGYKSVEEAFNAAGARVRKWHPDGSDLTNFENKVARRTFMFYSWMRKALPLVVETLVMQPGKAMVFPKAMYAFAEANGVDLESLSNPFPVDQLFPEFLTDQIIGPHFGEAGDYGGINPGEPVTETVSQWGVNDPQRTLMGALSPVARVPMELLTGTTLGTGGSINDKTDYLDSQIPGVNYAAKVSGHSITGLGEPTRDVEKEFTAGGFNENQFINFLTGIGLRDYSKPNYINRAELEKREREREARNG